MSLEYGVEFAYPDGATFTAAGYTLAGARRMLNSGAPIEPRAVRVLVRDVGDWRPLEDDQ